MIIIRTAAVIVQGSWYSWITTANWIIRLPMNFCIKAPTLPFPRLPPLGNFTSWVMNPNSCLFSTALLNISKYQYIWEGNYLSITFKNSYCQTQPPHFHVLKWQPHIMSLPIPKFIDVHGTVPENSTTFNYSHEYASYRISGRKSWETYTKNLDRRIINDQTKQWKRDQTRYVEKFLSHEKLKHSIFRTTTQ